MPASRDRHHLDVHHNPKWITIINSYFQFYSEKTKIPTAHFFIPSTSSLYIRRRPLLRPFHFPIERKWPGGWVRLKVQFTPASFPISILISFVKYTMTDAVQNSHGGDIPTSIEIKDSPSASSDAAIASTSSKITDSAVSPLRSESIGNMTESEDDHVLFKSIRKQVEKYSTMEPTMDPPASTHRLSEYTNEYEYVGDNKRDEKIILVQAEMVIAEPIKLIDNKDVEVVHTPEGAEVTLSPSHETRTTPEGTIGVAPSADDDDDAMKDQALKLIEQYGKDGEAMLLASLEAEANAKAAVAQQMLAALEEEVAAKAEAAEEAILRATRALEAIRGMKSVMPTHAAESNIAATIAMAKRERKGELPIVQAVDIENREQSPEVESTDSGSIPNDLSSQATVDDENKIPDPPVIVRRTALPSEDLIDPPDDISQISCLPPPPEEFTDQCENESYQNAENGTLMMPPTAVQTASEPFITPTRSVSGSAISNMDENVTAPMPNDCDFPNEEDEGCNPVQGANQAHTIEAGNPDSKPATSLDRVVDIAKSAGVTPSRVAKAYVDARISQIDPLTLRQQDEKKRMTKPCPEMGPGRPSRVAGVTTNDKSVSGEGSEAGYGDGVGHQGTSASVVPLEVTTPGGAIRHSNLQSPAAESQDGSLDDELTRSPSSNSKITTSSTLETIYGKIDQCRAKASDPATSPLEQMASIALMEKLARVAVSFKAVEELDRC